jgi:hypothetical protein
LGARDARRAGNIKRAGRIHRQIFIDAHAKAALRKPHGRKITLTADTLNDAAIPFFDAHEHPP